LNKAALRRRFNNRIDGPAGMSFAQSTASLGLSSGGPATTFGFDAFRSRPLAPNLAFRRLGANLADNGNGRTFGATADWPTASQARCRSGRSLARARLAC